MLGNVIQVLIALGIFNVWLLRPVKATKYRGAGAENLRQEFTAYGLSKPAMYIVGFFKIAFALALILGIWLPVLVIPAAIGLGVLMTGAIVMHLKVGDPFNRFLPAGILLLGCVLAGLLQWQAGPLS